MTLNINQKITLVMVIFFLVPLFMFTATVFTTKRQENDSLIVNLAGRQRMLSQKMTKECLTYLHLYQTDATAAEKTRLILFNSIAVFETTLNALIHSGVVPITLDLKGEKKSVPAATGATAQQLKAAKNLWDPFKAVLENIINSRDMRQVDALLKDNLSLLAAMDKATGLMQEEAESKVELLFYEQLAAQILGAIIVGLVIYWTKKSIVTPIHKSVAFAETLSKGDLQHTLEINQKDEIGNLGLALNQTVQTLARMIRRINRDVITLNESSGEMNSVADEMASFSDNTVNKANTVAAAAEETDSAMNSVATAMEQAYTNVDSVASATEELSASISEITQRTGEASDRMKDAVEEARLATNQVAELGKAAQEIGAVSETISTISDKTSLLALNATIEAARAGDAGKGFAVVASEIKELAQKTNSATGEIKGQLQGVQQLTDKTATIIESITQFIEHVSLIIFGINESVEQQSMATKEITQNILQTSQGLKEVNQNVAQTKEATGKVAQEISEVTESAEQLSNSSAMVQRTAGRLNELSEQLKKLVGNFKISDQETESHLIPSEET